MQLSDMPQTPLTNIYQYIPLLTHVKKETYFSKLKEK